MEHNPKLTAAELAVLWDTYMTNSMANCMVLHLSKVSEDPAINPIFQTSFSIINFALNEIKKIFTNENVPIPIGFNENDDLNESAPRLYSDLFTMRYLKYMSGISNSTYSIALELSARQDIRNFFTKLIEMNMKQFNQACELQLQKGTFIRTTTIPAPEKAEYAQKESFLSGLLGKHRPLTAIEMSHVGKNSETNSVGRTFVLGFGQVAKNPEVRKFMERGKEIAEKHETVFRDIYLQDDLPLPSAWDSTISQSTVAPFSDKLMMFHTSVLNAVSIASYGGSIGGSMRKDLGAHYSRLIAEVLEYATDGAKIMIENGWLEQPPQVPDRKALRQ